MDVSPGHREGRAKYIKRGAFSLSVFIRSYGLVYYYYHFSPMPTFYNVTFLCGRVIVREPVVFTHHSWRFGIWAKSRASGKEKEHKTGVTFSFTLSGCARVLLFFIFYSFVGAPGLLCIWLGAVFLLV